MDDQDFETNLGMSRRTLIKRTAVVGAGVAWATPVVQSLAGTALAQTGTPSCTFDVIANLGGGACYKVGTATAPQECCDCLQGGSAPGECDDVCEGTNFTPVSPPQPVPCP